MAAVPAPYYNGSVVTRDTIANFIPNRWLGEIRMYRDRKFHLAMATKTFDFTGQKGDTIHIPLVGRAAVYDRVPGQPVRLQTQAPGQYSARVDRDKESSYGIDNIVQIQSQYDTRTVYTKAAGYAMARDLDNALLGLRAGLPASQQIFVSTGVGAGTAAGDPAPLSKASIEAAMQLMMEADYDISECKWIISPNMALDLANIDQYISGDYQLANMKSGIVGMLYGLPVHITTQITNNRLDGYKNGEDAPGQPTPGVIGSPYLPTQDVIVGTGLPRGKTGNEVAQPFSTGMLVHPNWALLLKQKNITVEASREVLLQMDAMVTNQVYGTKLYEMDAAVLLHVQGSTNPLA